MSRNYTSIEWLWQIIVLDTVDDRLPEHIRQTDVVDAVPQEDGGQGEADHARHAVEGERFAGKKTGSCIRTLISSIINLWFFERGNNLVELWISPVNLHA